MIETIDLSTCEVVKTTGKFKGESKINIEVIPDKEAIVLFNKNSSVRQK